ncbi:MAG: ATP-binding protein [Anaerolineales bacterium]
MKFKFLDRDPELELLDRLWDSESAEFLVLYGRRRIGKTALLIEWMLRSSRRALYWVASPTSNTLQLQSFSKAIYNFSHLDARAPDTFTYATWEQAFQEIGALSKNERMALFIDEFTFLLETDPSIAGQLQNLWDHTLSRCNLFLCLSGSQFGMMRREFLSPRAPLYGRASAKLDLQALPFASTQHFFPKYSAVDRVALYSIFGGVPAYWERVNPAKSLSSNIKSQLLTPNNITQGEPRLLLQDFVSKPHNYIAVLSAIANGAHTLREIAAVTGIRSQPTKYLSVLMEAGFVTRRVPITLRPKEQEESRAGRYHITDPYLRFYYRFLAEQQDQLALRIQDRALAEINRHMIDFIGQYTWEELCREWTLRAGVAGELPGLPKKVGSAWNALAQVDVAAINYDEKVLILGECKWTATPNERQAISNLVEDGASKIVPEQGKWGVFFLGFSRAGWTAGAIAYQKQVNAQPVKGTNWISMGMRLVELDELDRDLERWTFGQS